MEIEKRVIGIIAKFFGCPERDVKMDTNLERDLDCDSLDFIELVMNAEKEFGISIDDGQYNVSQSSTVKELCDELEKIIN